MQTSPETSGLLRPDPNVREGLGGKRAGLAVVLVADDEPYMQRLLQYHLERDGYEVLKAGTGREALDIVRREKPDLVIMDYMLPELNGLEALRASKGSESSHNIPFIMITANTHLLSREEAEECGAALFLTKPFSPSQLLREVRRLTEKPDSGAVPEMT